MSDGYGAAFRRYKQKTQRERERERERERGEDNTLLHKDNDLSTSRHFYKSVPDDKHSNTLNTSNREREREREREKERGREKGVEKSNSGVDVGVC